MAMQICFKLEDRTVCFPFPVLTDPWKGYYPSWGPAGLKRPQPDPWIIDDLLDKAILKDIAVLAAIDQLTAELSPGLKKGLQTAVRAEIKKIVLPAGITLQESKPAKKG